MNLQMDRIQQACETLKLNAVAVEWPADFLEQLLNVELKARIQRTRDAFLKFAGLPSIKCIEDYDFKFATGAPRKQLQELTSLTFIQRAENIVLLGPSGVGKSQSHVAVSHRKKTRPFRDISQTQHTGA